MLTKRNRTIMAMTFLTVGAVAVLSVAGPLNPPPGAPTSTYKTLSQVEPRTSVQSLPSGPDCLFLISQPGSYYLTGNIQGVAGKHGIRIASDEVVLDLNGFTLQGVPGAIDGVTMEGGTGYRAVTVRNGNSSGWRDGIAIGQVTAGAVIDVHAQSNSRNGVTAGSGVVLTRCTSTSNAFAGMSLFVGCTLIDCAAASNGGVGIQAASGSTFSRCTSSLNGSHGIAIYGVLSPGADSTIVNCTSERNGGAGIIADVLYNGVPDRGVTVLGCTVAGNTNDGIRVLSNSVVSGNNANNNGFGSGLAAGIHATGSKNRIDGNSVSDNDQGILTDVPGCFVIKNNATGNATHYALAPGTSYGQILNVTGVAITTDQPWANFVH